MTSASGGSTDLRTARLAALYVPDQESASPFIAPGPFTATWEGYITKDIWEKTTFSAEGSGALTVTLNDKAVLTCPGPDLAGPTGTIRVDKGRTRLRITYTAPATGVARARLFWETRDIPREPVPPTVFVHNVADKPFKAALKQHHGLAQLGALRCTKCHQSDASAAAGGLPELATDAPDLREAGGQFNAAWMARWIADPQALRPGAAMPRLLHGADAPQAAADIAAFLATLGKAAEFTPSRRAAHRRRLHLHQARLRGLPRAGRRHARAHLPGGREGEVAAGRARRVPQAAEQALRVDPHADLRLHR